MKSPRRSPKRLGGEEIRDDRRRDADARLGREGGRRRRRASGDGCTAAARPPTPRDRHNRGVLLEGPLDAKVPVIRPRIAFCGRLPGCPVRSGILLPRYVPEAGFAALLGKLAHPLGQSPPQVDVLYHRPVRRPPAVGGPPPQPQRRASGDVLGVSGDHDTLPSLIRPEAASKRGDDGAKFGAVAL